MDRKYNFEEDYNNNNDGQVEELKSPRESGKEQLISHRLIRKNKMSPPIRLEEHEQQ